MENFEMSKKIKELRTKRGLSQEQLAEISGLSLRIIQRVENGDNVPRGDTLSRLANALQISPDEIIGWQQAKNNSGSTMKEISRNFFDDWKKPVFCYLLSICLFIICCLFNSPILFKMGMVLFVIGFLIIFYSLLHQFSKKRWKSGLLLSIIVVLSLIGYIVIFTFEVKSTSTRQTRKVERIK